jgi:hypothetical protein
MAIAKRVIGSVVPAANLELQIFLVTEAIPPTTYCFGVTAQLTTKCAD